MTRYPLRMNPVTLAVLVALAGTASGVSASPTPGAAIGSETLVNTTTTNSQSRPRVAVDAAGDYVVTWSSNGQDGSSYGVYAQRYHVDGTPNGSEFLVNTTTTGNQSDSQVAMDAAGDFVIVWSSAGQDGDQLGVYGQLFDNTGATVGSEFLVNTTTTGDQFGPSVAMDAAGDFVVSWDSDPAPGDHLDSIYAQAFDATGAANGTEFRVNTSTADNRDSSRIAMDAAGDFVVVWESGGGQDGDGYGVYAQRYDSTAATVGSEFRVNTTITADQYSPSVAMDAAGDFTVTWVSYIGSTDAGDIFAQRYASTGTKAGSEFKVNTTTAALQDTPDVAMDATGDFIITWMSYAQDGSHEGVYAKRFDSTGAVVGSEFPVNTTTTNIQDAPRVAMDAAGDVVDVWQSYLQDGALFGVYAQRYARESSLDLAAGIALTPTGNSISRGASLVFTTSAFNLTTAVTPTGNATIDAALTTATGITATVNLPADVTFVDVSGTDWTCPATPTAGVLVCTYDLSLAAGDATPSLVVDATAPSVESALHFSNAVSADQADGTASDDTETVDTITGSAPVAKVGTLAVDRNTTRSAKLKSTDADADPLTFSKVGKPAHGTLSVTAAGHYSYKPAKNFVGTDHFTFKSNDGVLDSNIARITVTVTEHTPTATGTTFSMTHNTSHTAQLKGSDVDAGDTLTYSKVAAPAHGVLTLHSNGSYTYVPAHNFKGIDSFTFHVSDGLKTSATAKVTIGVR